MKTWTPSSAALQDIPGTGISLDLTDMRLDALDSLKEPLEHALQAMSRLEAGAIANPSEGRQVGHYWLRSPDLAPESSMSQAIRTMGQDTGRLAGRLLNELGARSILHLGIGGSALGPQLLAEALGQADPAGAIPPSAYRVLDNTDPDGLSRSLAGIDLRETAVLVVSKSGGTVETHNGMTYVRSAFERAAVPFAPHAVAITEQGSRLDQLAREESWLGRLPMWSWVGGRTSITSAVGLLPLALLGSSPDRFLAGAAAMDIATRSPLQTNPAALLAACWVLARQDHPRAMVVLPYADRLCSFGRYLQQLVMESLGKRQDRHGQEHRTGIVVYGNKGSTDQHAYVQQLRDGPDDFFTTFIEVLRPSSPDLPFTGEISLGDHLSGFLAGTRKALAEDGKQSLSIAIEELDVESLGALIALFERTVGIYAEIMDINAYDQPGVEAGKKGAAGFIEAQKLLTRALGSEPQNATELCLACGWDDPLSAWRILRRLAVRGDRGVSRLPGADPSQDRFFRA